MASIIPGYEYDIFISYRHNDNLDGWVSEFVQNLEKELRGAIKESVSVYFDTNPHDGLLEIHNVDKSLEGKLKCLIFIPIISQTYCDSKSFAWQHEFLAFNKMAKEDPFGRDIKLFSGNVTSRILPIKIHDLDADDKKLLENELDGILRSIEFIYKASGVNRSLKPNDERSENLNHTYYRDQINKVANAVKEIINAIKKHNQSGGELPMEGFIVNPERPKKLKHKIIIASFIVLTLLVAAYFFIPVLFKPDDINEKSIAVLPFKSLSDDRDKQYLADGVMDAILLHLQKFTDLRVMSRTSVEQYRGTTKTTHVIGQELDVEYLLEGSFQKNGDDVRLIVQLIKAREESHAWANEYNRNWKDIFSVQSEVAQTIAKELYTVITPDEKQLTEKIPTKDMIAYDLYLKATNNKDTYLKTRDLSHYQKAVNFYKTALEIDTTFAKAYVGLAMIYFERYSVEDFFKENFLDSCMVLLNIALSFDDQLDEAYFVKAQYNWANGKNEEALRNIDHALKINPNYYNAYFYKGYILTNILIDFVKGIDNYQKALILIRGEERASLLRNLGEVYLSLGFIDKAKYYYAEAFALDGNEANNFSSLAWIEFSLENFEEALKLTKKAFEIDSTLLMDLVFYSVPSGHINEAYLHAEKWIEYSEKYGYKILNSLRLGYAFYQVAKYKEADFYFNQQIKYSEGSIKLNRDYALWKGAYYDLAATYAFKGDKEKAYHYLDEYSTLNFYSLFMVSLAKHDPLFNSIRNEDRFQKILQTMEGKYQAEGEKVRKWLEEQGQL